MDARRKPMGERDGHPPGVLPSLISPGLSPPIKTGSEQEFDGHPILSGFLQNPTFRPGRRHALSLQQQVPQILVPPPTAQH